MHVQSKSKSLDLDYIQMSLMINMKYYSIVLELYNSNSNWELDIILVYTKVFS